MTEPPGNRSLLPLAGIAFVKLAFHLTTARGYGRFRDELYYLASTNHLAWRYVEHPPLSTAVLVLSRSLLGDSLIATRFLPALAGAATVFVAGLIRPRDGRRSSRRAARGTRDDNRKPDLFIRELPASPRLAAGAGSQ